MRLQPSHYSTRSRTRNAVFASARLWLIVSWQLLLGRRLLGSCCLEMRWHRWWRAVRHHRTPLRFHLSASLISHAVGMSGCWNVLHLADLRKEPYARVLHVPVEVRRLWDKQRSRSRWNDTFEIEGVGPPWSYWKTIQSYWRGLCGFTLLIMLRHCQVSSTARHLSARAMS